MTILSNTERKAMHKPFFSLRPMKNRLGCWDPLRREICLSRHFASSATWCSVREILLHEMAHQFTDEVLQIHDPSPHGPAFKKACRRLRANPKACHPNIPDGLANPTATENRNNRILVRIKKLLALADSKNRFEAESAMLKAHELTAKYNIDLIANRSCKRNYTSMVIGVPALRHRREVYRLAALLTDFYFVQGIWISAFVLEKEKMGRVLEISGTSHNVQNAAYVHDFVRRYINFHWEQYKEGRRLSASQQTDFATGIIAGFHSRLFTQRRAMAHDGTGALPMVIEDPQLDKYMKYRYPRTAPVKITSSRRDLKIHDAGLSLGRKLIIHKGIVTRKRGIRMLPRNV